MYVTFKSLKEQGDQTPMKMSGPADPASHSASTTAPSELCIQNSFKAAGWDGPASQTTLARNSLLSQFSEGSPKDTTAHRQVV